MPAVNNVTIAQLIIRVLTYVNIDFNNVLALISDNATNMKKCFTDGLRGLMPNAVHVTCWAHILSLVGEFRTALELTDTLVASMKSIFSNAPGRRARYRNHLSQRNVANITMPPNPVLTRWNTWFSAALYHGNHLHYYADFIESEITQVGTTIQLRKLLMMLRGNQFEQLQALLEFIALHCERLMNTLKALESHDYRSVDIYNTVRDLLSWLRSPGFMFATSGCEAAMQNAVEKLSDYVEGTKQPAISLFKAVRF